MNVSVFDPRICELGEGAFWHPERKQAFWFDILGKRLLSREDGEEIEWRFDERVSAAGWIDHDRLVIASESALSIFDLRDGKRSLLVPLEMDNAATRSNDGKADPMGGFWISTMGVSAQADAGAIYRYYHGELRQLRAGISIPNAICFSPAGDLAYFADTDRQIVWRQPLDSQGWPAGEAEVFLDLSAEGLFPDGAEVDAQGRFWNAQWGAGRVACYDPQGKLLKTMELPAKQTSCPAFIGPALDRLMVTSAAGGVDGPDDGRTWLVEGPGLRGKPTPRVALSS